MDKSKIMSHIKRSKKIFTNEDTVRKRAWIDKALSGVRGRFGVGKSGVESTERPSKSHLYLVDSDRPR